MCWVHLGEHTRSYMSLSIETNVLSLGAWTPSEVLGRWRKTLPAFRLVNESILQRRCRRFGGGGTVPNMEAVCGCAELNDGLGMIATAEGALMRLPTS